jgi:hypothetical protein
MASSRPCCIRAICKSTPRRPALVRTEAGVHRPTAVIYFPHMDKNTKDLLEAVNFIKDHMATKDDIAHLDGRIDKLDAKIDGLDTKLTKFEEGEIDKRKQLEVRVTKIEKHLGLDKKVAA